MRRVNTHELGCDPNHSLQGLACGGPEPGGSAAYDFLPLILIIGMPLIMGLFIVKTDPKSPDLADFVTIINQLPAGLLGDFGEGGLIGQILIYVLIYFFAPLFLMIPVMVASVIAADSFAGERERKTLEALLYTPTSDAELYAGKMLAPWLAAIIVSVASFIAYAIVVNVVGAPLLGHIFFPNLMWIILAFWVAPAGAGLGLGTMVLASSRVNTFQEAYQLGSLVVLPVIILLVGQMAGIVFFTPAFVALVGLVIWLIDFGLLWFGAHIFARSKLLARL